jgi:hypothetical protein
MRLLTGKSLLAVCTALASVASVASIAQSGSPKPEPSRATSLATAPPTAQEIADLEWMRARTKVGVPYQLDLSQPNQYRFLMTMLRRAGDSKERSPHMFSLLAESSRRGPGADPKIAVNTGPDGQANGTPQTLSYVNSLSATGPQSFSASGLLSVNNGTASSQIIISLLSNNQTFAANQGEQLNQGQYYTVAVSGTVPNSGTIPADSGPVTAEANAAFLYVPQGSHTPVANYYRGEASINPTSACIQLPNYCVRDGNQNCVSGQYQTTCTNTVTNTTPIKVCYYRGSQQECDYWNQAPAHPTNFVFPLQGYAQFSQNIFTTGTTATGAATITLENPTKGGGCYLVFQQLAPLAAANWNVPAATPNQLNWTFPAASFPDPNSCLEYYNATNTYMHVQVLGLVMTNQQFGQFEFTSNRSQIGQPGIYIVPQIQIQQGCMAAGTQIRLADGTEKAIETFALDQPRMVKSGIGDSAVLEITSGIEPLPMIHLRTDKGQEILVTRTHPIVTPTGPVMASALKLQDKVLTEDGPATLIEVKQEIYSGKVFNLRVGDTDDSDFAHMTLQANGFIVGDARMQAYFDEDAQEQERLAASTPATIETVPPEWREDFLRHQSANK